MLDLAGYSYETARYDIGIFCDEHYLGRDPDDSPLTVEELHASFRKTAFLPSSAWMQCTDQGNVTYGRSTGLLKSRALHRF
jgi:hypothetical protein